MTDPENQYNNAAKYNQDSLAAEWDSPGRIQRLAAPFISAGTIVLDLGIGTGQSVEGYTQKGAHVIGIDHDSSMLEAARTVVGYESDLRIGDINAGLPVEDLVGSVDLVQAVGVLEFVIDLASIVGKVNVILRSGGTFVFTAEIIPEDSAVSTVEKYPDAGVTVYRHTLLDIETVLADNGFKLLSQESYGGYSRNDNEPGKVPYVAILAQKVALSPINIAV